MSIRYCEYELLELFENEPLSDTLEQDTGLITYRKEDEYGLSILFSFDIAKNFCVIKFFYKPWETPIFELELTKVMRLECTKDSLTIRRSDGKNEVLVRFKHHLSIEILKEEEVPLIYA